MKSLRRFEGHLLLDNRSSPGIPEDMVRKADLPAGCGKGLFEAATYTCSHCQRVVVIENKRTRERAYCTSCDHLICDECGKKRALAGGACVPFKKLVDDIRELGARGLPFDGKIILP